MVLTEQGYNTLQEEHLAWLGGLIDGRGYLKVAVYRKSAGIGFQMRFALTIAGLDKEILRKAEGIWKDLGYSVSWSKYSDKGWAIMVWKLDSVIHFMKLMLKNDFVTGKTKKQYVIFLKRMLPILRSRTAHPTIKRLKCWTRALFLEAVRMKEEIAKCKGPKQVKYNEDYFLKLGWP